MSWRTPSTLLLAGPLLLLACATPSASVRQQGESREQLHPTERWLVTRAAADQPMEVVLDDSGAGDRFLRTPSRPLQHADPDLEHLLARMLATVQAEEGVGIAAPQVGINRRVIWVKRLDLEPEQPFVAYLNPELRQRSEETVVDWEGCLSVPAGFGQVRRAQSVLVAYDAADGTRAEERVEGFTARIFQHEVDHLDGVLFIDRREPGALLPEAEYRAMRARERAAQSVPAGPDPE